MFVPRCGLLGLSSQCCTLIAGQTYLPLFAGAYRVHSLCYAWYRFVRGRPDLLQETVTGFGDYAPTRRDLQTPQWLPC